MNLRDKIFRFGIYGQKISHLSQCEIEELKSKDWAEFLTPEDLNSFKNDFTLIPFDNSKIISKDCYVRMNLQAWRAYLFGSNFITKNKFHFLIADYLIQNPEFIPLSKLRSQFGIDPKTLHYICKKFKEKNLIIEEKKVKDSEIKINEIFDRTDLGKDQSIQDTTEKISKESLQNFIYFNNMNFIDQLRYHIDRAENGIGSKELSQIYGMKAKIALKHIYRMCDLFPDFYKLVSSIDQKHQAFKIFSIENLDKRNQRKLQNMTNNDTNTEDLLLSSKDRQEALKILANKYKFFPLSKEIVAEISKMTGYPYEIDRKNLIKNSKDAGLKVFKLDQRFKYKYIISLPDYNESAIYSHYKKPEYKLGDEKFFKLLKKYLIHNEKNTINDNGYCDILDISRSAFYRFLFRLNLDEFHFDYDIVGKMPVFLFYKLIKIKKFLFRAKCSHDIFTNRDKSNLELEILQKLNKLDANNLFIEEEEPRRLDNRIFEAVEIIENSKLKNYIACLSDEFQEYLREISKPLKFLRKLKSLEKKNLIELKINESNCIFVKIFRVDKFLHNENSVDSQSLRNYNTRAYFVNLMRASTYETFSKDYEEVFTKYFNKSEQKYLYEQLKPFMKETGVIDKDKQAVLNLEFNSIYLNIKKMLVFQIPITFSSLAAYSHNDIMNTLKYMSKQEIISGFRMNSSLDNITIHNRFKSYVSHTKFEEIPSDFIYFSELYPKIANIINEAGSIDFDQILFKSKFLEPFELTKFFEIFGEDFSFKEVDGFQFISPKSIPDPFEF